jgi:hypothetical protein
LSEKLEQTLTIQLLQKLQLCYGILPWLGTGLFYSNTKLPLLQRGGFTLLVHKFIFLKIKSPDAITLPPAKKHKPKNHTSTCKKKVIFFLVKEIYT